MGCMQVRVEPNRSDNQTESNESKTTSSQVEFIRNKPSKFERSMTFSTAMHSTPVTMIESLIMTTSGISAKSGDLTQQSTTLVQSFNTNDYRETGINGTLNEFDTSIDWKGTVNTQDNVPQIIDKDSNVSEIPEVSSMSITSSELDQLSSIYSSDASSAFGLDHKKSHRDAIHGILPAKSKRSKTHRTPKHNNIRSGSEESYSLRDSFITSISTDSKKLASDRAKNIRTTVLRPKISRVQRKILANQPHSESDESILHRVPRKKSVLTAQLPSTRLSNPDDHPKKVIT